jgi:4-alpha-glucanotransferase
VRFPRSSGILLHPTSLPGRFGIGELGREAYAFADFLQASGQKLWQVLPLNPTGYGDSPYQCFSAFAGNPLLISLESLGEQGWLDSSDLGEAPHFPDKEVDFGAVIRFKYPLLRKAAQNFAKRAKSDDLGALHEFCGCNAHWLDDFALFMAVKEAHEGVIWTKWSPELVNRDAAGMKAWRERLRPQIEANKFWQYEFFRQWRALKTYCNDRGIRIMGDLPIYVAHDSADVWASPHLFWLDEDGSPEKVAGVPADYFSATGQLWGNPIYRWDLLKGEGYKWWIERLRGSLALYDLMRLDHFRGFEAYWEIPAGEKTAIKGKWVKGPGADLFRVLQNALGELPIVAENLGVITPEVEGLRKEFGFPGMAILQFAFGIDAQAPSFRPHNYTRDTVAYTGSHDNDTAVGWWRGGAGDSIRTQQDVETEHAFAKAYLAFEDEPIHWVLIRHVMMSVAETALIPLQDVLGVGSEGRMNLPGSFGKNWRWRCQPGAVQSWMAERLRKFAEMYDR